MSAKYLLRLDDACPTMRAPAWDEMEMLLDRLDIRPLVGVVPENADPDLMLDPPSPAFWDRVRRWQAKGWAIGMHGYRHVFHAVPRSSLLLPFYDKSEFAGLSLQEQRSLVARSWIAFAQEGIRPTVWIAPAHCFDIGTLQAIEHETPIRTVSDGLGLNQFHAHRFHWLPQQLWTLEPRRSGLWTVCMHPNNMTADHMREFARRLALPYFRDRMVSLDAIPLSTRRKSFGDRLFEQYFWAKARAFKARTWMSRLWRRGE